MHMCISTRGADTPPSNGGDTMATLCFALQGELVCRAFGKDVIVYKTDYEDKVARPIHVLEGHTGSIKGIAVSEQHSAIFTAGSLDSHFYRRL